MHETIAMLSSGKFRGAGYLGVIKISFGEMFDRPITGVVWPASLLTLSFGKMFNQPIATVVRPASLEALTIVRG